MRPLNLTPPEDRRGDSAPLRAGVVSYAIVGVLAAALLAVVTLVLTGNDINESKSELASLEARKAAADQTAAGLAPYNDFAALTTTRNQTVSDLARSRFDWERVLQELALVIPPDVTLETLSATAAANTAAAGGAAAGTGEISGPSLQISGCADGQEGVARMLAALRDIDGVTRVGMQSSALGGEQAAPVNGSAGAPTACGGESVANFQVTIAFDSVPVAAPTTDPSAVPATGTTPAPAAPTTDATAATADDGVAETEAEQNATVDSANTQTRRARNAAGATGAGE